MNINNTRRLISIGLVVVLAAIFAIVTDSFLTTKNIMLLLKDSAYVGLMALGVSFVIVGGGIDLSGGGIVCLVGILVARFSFFANSAPGFIILLFAAIAGAALGGVNSVFVTKLNISEFVTTLASNFLFSGLALMFAFREGGRLTSR